MPSTNLGVTVEASLHQTCVNTIKGLAMDGVQAANSGHPGMPMGMADTATVLWTQFLKFDGQAPNWPDRDRFVLSAGHGSMLIYSLLHLAGFDLPLDEIKNFRQWDSKTPGHPEFGHTAGVETTTGPLGQGVANAVGFAMTERWLRESFGEDLCDHHTWAIAGDGCLMEGVAYEAASLAGHLKLGRLNVIYDDNQITIDGGTEISFTEDVAARMTALGWHVLRVDGHDQKALMAALREAKATDDKPSLICARTVIGQGSPNHQGTSKTHGSPLGDAEIALVKQAMGMDPSKTFVVPKDARDAFTGAAATDERKAWEARLAAHPKRAQFEAIIRPNIEDAIKNAAWPSFEAGSKLATRKSSLACLKALCETAPWLVGGSADLAGSNGTKTGGKQFTPTVFKDAAVINFGVREHAMGAICNGMVLHGGMIPYCATFLAFHDYQRPAVRLSALMNQPVIYIYTHDSIFLGEDGPTHQPIAALAAMRATPNVKVLRPADAKESAACWREALRNRTGPTSLVLTRQGLPVLDLDQATVDKGVADGGYAVVDHANPNVVLLASGSEVATCVDAAEVLRADGVHARVLSVPCLEAFLGNKDAQKRLLPTGVPRLAVEAGSTMPWRGIVGFDGDVVGLDRFGASAPAAVLAEKFGFTGAAVAAKAKGLLG